VLASLVLTVDVSILMNSIPVWMHLQEGPVTCPQCGSAVRLAPDLCLRCLLSVGLDAGDDTSETLDDLLGDIDLQDAEYSALNENILPRITTHSAITGDAKVTTSPFDVGLASG
jgi:hypothetical protein